MDGENKWTNQDPNGKSVSNIYIYIYIYILCMYIYIKEKEKTFESCRVVRPKLAACKSRSPG